MKMKTFNKATFLVLALTLLFVQLGFNVTASLSLSDFDAEIEELQPIMSTSSSGGVTKDCTCTFIVKPGNKCDKARPTCSNGRSNCSGCEVSNSATILYGPCHG